VLLALVEVLQPAQAVLLAPMEVLLVVLQDLLVRPALPLALLVPLLPHLLALVGSRRTRLVINLSATTSTSIVTKQSKHRSGSPLGVLLSRLCLFHEALSQCPSCPTSMAWSCLGRADFDNRRYITWRHCYPFLRLTEVALLIQIGKVLCRRSSTPSWPTARGISFLDHLGPIL